MFRDRNYRCRIKQDLIYKGYETIVMENECFRLMVLPGKGTDVVELLYKPTDTDFCWFTRLGLRRKEELFTDFQLQYEGGWQEVLPNLGGKHVHHGVPMEAYGEASLTSWSHDIVEDHPDHIAVRFVNHLRTLPLRVEKLIKMSSKQKGFEIRETVHNESPAVIHFDWGHHITFGTPFLRPGTELELPRPYPPYRVPERGSEGGFEARAIDEGRYRLVREDGIGAEVSWNHKVWPYLWFWKDFGGERTAPYFGSHFNVGLEVFSSPPAATLDDSVNKGTALRLHGFDHINSDLQFSVIDHLSPSGKGDGS